MDSDNQYDSHAYHDNTVHGIRFLVEDFLSEVVFDIDHIVRWPVHACEADEKSVFKVAKGNLRFSDVTDLNVNIDWGKSGYTTAVSGTSIDKIERRTVATTLRLPAYYHWDVLMTDGRSTVSFGASGMSFEIKGESIDVERQYLNGSERNR